MSNAAIGKEKMNAEYRKLGMTERQIRRIRTIFDQNRSTIRNQISHKSGVKAFKRYITQTIRRRYSYK